MRFRDYVLYPQVGILEIGGQNVERNHMYNHLSFRDRVIIQYMIENYPGVTASKISKKLGVHVSTIYRELKRFRVDKGSRLPTYSDTNHKTCTKLQNFPFVCNGCLKHQFCVRQVYLYDAVHSYNQANELLKKSRRKPRISKEQLLILNAKISLRVKANQSLYHILQSDNTITLFESTIRRYINKEYLDCRNIDLPRTVRFRVLKPHSTRRKRKTNAGLLLNRTFDDYQDYTQTLPRVTVQLDLLVGKSTDKKALLTFYEPLTKFQWALVVFRKSSSVNRAIEKVINQLIKHNSLFLDCVLIDNGLEFMNVPNLEVDDQGVIRFKTFFCDPYASYQKAGCERNHSLVRYLIRKGESLDLCVQHEIDNCFSHINSLKRKSLQGLSSFEMFSSTFQIDPTTMFNIRAISSKNLKLK